MTRNRLNEDNNLLRVLLFSFTSSFLTSYRPAVKQGLLNLDWLETVLRNLQGLAVLAGLLILTEQLSTSTTSIHHDIVYVHRGHPAPSVIHCAEV